MMEPSKPMFALYFSVEFLSLSDLTSFSLVSKSCCNSITIKAVLYAAMNKTGDLHKSRKSMEKLYELALAKKIHVPSTLRTLRIAQGRKCEFCYQDIHLNTLHDRGFGTFACWDCIQSERLSSDWYTRWARYVRDPSKYDLIFNHPRNACLRPHANKYRIWRHHRTASGENIGPIIAWNDIDRIKNSMSGATTADQYLERMNAYIAEALSTPPIEDYTRFTTAYDEVNADLLKWREQNKILGAEKKRHLVEASTAKGKRQRKAER